MSVITRFAPSPTGYLHVGNVRTAIVSWLFARSMGGKFILRIDDTDVERSKDEYTEAIKEDLKWLGLDWDRIEFQSNRVEKYEAVKERLIKEGRLYPCYETKEELEMKKKIMLNRNLPPIYDRASLKLSDEKKRELEEQGIKPHWRFLIDKEDIVWDDGVRGNLHFKAANISDPVLIRADGSMTYTIATVWDDIEFGITDIIRGEDHVTNSAIHIQIFKALGSTPPNFAHLSLLNSKSGEISKRIGGFDIRSLRESGIEPMAINSFLAKIGTSDPIEIKSSLEELIKDFSIKKFSKSPVNYDISELERLNTKLVHNLKYSEVKERLNGLNIGEVDESFWEAVKPNINTIKEVELWSKICREDITPTIDDKDFTASAAELLPEEEVTINTWDEWISKIKEKTGKSGKNLFMPLRKAITGMEHGPELKYILPLIGRDKIIARLGGEKA
ncbi:glutamyl-tRNA ligase [endosymbiont of Acanthamoeba sp. UWC8]|uniref:glutamate--tRNA ligase n=1 Tax=endosymbiont of Acanthamoeba sp. UWC8 TaxID=86106 RepID=UPI0004D19E13|nr:glutamate--tRNA ligase [endosymbiont of Acanthamoeba sp. UWC8]AIF80872.1 glutamyl-tRNA ligase [endosymbiont of Acanthamoeba sp. UWC8]